MTDITVKSRRFSSPAVRGLLIGLLVVVVLSGVAVATSVGRLPALVFLLSLAYAVGALSKRQEIIEEALAENDPASDALADIKSNLDDASRIRVQALVKRNHELLALYSLANIVGASLELDEVLAVSLEGVIKTFGAHAGEITVVGAPERTLSMYCSGDQVISSHRGPKAPRISRRLVARVTQEGSSVLVSGPDDGPAAETVMGAKGISQLAAFPVKSKGRVIGVVIVALPVHSAIEEEDKELLGAIGAMVGTAIENSQLYQRIKRISDTDPITGLFNHRYIVKKLNSEVRRASRYGHALSVLMLDVDDFKSLNDTYGHPFGDIALKKIALATIAACRDTDIVGRYGGDEFLLVLPETQAEAAVNVSDRVRSRIQNLSLAAKPDRAKRISLTASLGLAVYPASGKTGTDLVISADKNLYLSKRAGGDQVSGRMVA